MYSIDKYGKLKKQIDRYFLPYEINPNIIIEALKKEEKKFSSTSKHRKDAITKLNEEITKFDLLKVTGKQFQSNFSPIRLQKPKTRTHTRDKILMGNPGREINKNQIKQILTQLFDLIVQLVSKESDAYLYADELSQLIKFKNHQPPQLNELKNYKSTYTESNSEPNDDDLQYFQKIIKNNQIFHGKILVAYEATKFKFGRTSVHRQSPVKKHQFSDTLKNKKFGPFKPLQLSPHQMKKIISFTQYREFIFLINFSNRISVSPDSDVLYKAFICKGNNGTLVKSILKTRPWWCLRTYTDIDNCCMQWTQWKKLKATNNLPINATRSKSQNSFHSNKIVLENLKPSALSLKREQLKKLIIIEENILNKYVEENEENYFQFTKKINEKTFLQHQKKFLFTNNLQLRQISDNRLLLNHVPGCLHLHSKRLLFLNLKKYYTRENKNVYDVVPLTFVISKGEDDPQYLKFIDKWNQIDKKSSKMKNIWICKPGENSNRGNGIAVVSNLDEIKFQIKNKNTTNNRSLIIQKYLEQPFLYNKRKFDIRCFILITNVNGITKGYWYNDGYLRTTSKQYNLKNLQNRLIHLTNDAIQKKGEEYGKYQNCNKLSFFQFQKYLEGEDSIKFVREVKPTLKQIATDLIHSVGYKLNPFRRQFCFQIFGLDFMLDRDLKPYLIEANSNPNLEVDGSTLGKIIPSLIQNTMKIAVDPLFPPPFSQNPKTTKFSVGNPFEQNKFELIYDSLHERKGTKGLINEEGDENEEENEEYIETEDME